MFKFDQLRQERPVDQRASCPGISKIADDICIVRSMHTEQINHDPAHTFMNTGTAITGRPRMGSWINYGLGSECDDLPGFVVLTSVGGRKPQPIASRQWRSGFLPSRFQGVEFHSQRRPGALRRATRPASPSDAAASVVDAVKQLESACATRRCDDPEIATRIAPVRNGVPHADQRAGADGHVATSRSTCSNCTARKPGDGSFAVELPAGPPAGRARRAVHSALSPRLGPSRRPRDATCTICCGRRPTARRALITDLKQRGMLDDTLVIWGGEFGRTPMFQGKGGPGRDHHIKGFSMWLAGGGIKRRHHLRRHRRARLQRRRKRRPRPRPARHDAAPAGHRPQAAHRQVPGPRLPADRRRRVHVVKGILA